MSSFSNPILFSKYFNVSPDTLAKAGLIDPFLTVDTQLFIDPILLDKSSNLLISVDAYNQFRTHFENVIRLLIISKKEGDTAWKAAQNLVSLREAPANGLGYGRSDRPGTSRPKELSTIILRTTKEIIELGAKDPEMISLMGFFEENVGPDTISDLTSWIIEPQLAKITNEFCNLHNIPVKTYSPTGIPLPHHTSKDGKERAIILVPTDIVRDLPVANDWAGIQEAAEANAEIRNRVNYLLAGIAKPKVVEIKEAIKSAVLTSADLLQEFINSVKDHTTFYDPNIDALGYYSLKKMLSDNSNVLKSNKKYDLQTDIDSVKQVVYDSIEMFKHHVENGNLWEELWINNKPKKERAAQLIYFAIADGFCKANNIDISPEANMGGGPIDFKYSKGYTTRVLVEMKKSTGTVVHGYETQLEIYKEAARTNYGIFIVMDYGNLGDKLQKILKIKEERIKNNEPASDIIVIDASQKVSASKRNL
ncbi:hypothetical protein SAMN04488128_101218 [Chitinophaga eiseniae]|uniref:Uncharacterized protein n=1 Tax=Chitinophaga eiseniae TaxID=634771 RepID=A0A1T4KN16_9BACT|nr:hypothetical protein [Chitinophaga eiseniae]SJZ43773.1 hypothetical protein SAMN04488128_101218 [Chitinophaga eiseniae]